MEVVDDITAAVELVVLAAAEVAGVGIVWVVIGGPVVVLLCGSAAYAGTQVLARRAGSDRHSGSRRRGD